MEVVEYIPNSDWKVIVGRLHQKGFTFSLSALLYVSLCSPFAQMEESSHIRFLCRFCFPSVSPPSTVTPFFPSQNIISNSLRIPYSLPLPSNTLLQQRKRTATRPTKQSSTSPTVFFKMAPTNWDHDAHLALLQAVMAKAPPSQAEWDQILEEVGRKGYVYTSGAAM